MKSRVVLAVVAGLAFVFLSLLAPSARASLTPSEQAQLRQFVIGGQVQDAARARSLVARTDLTPEESAEALKDAFAPTVFDEAHIVFVRDLLFGGASTASRPFLSVAVTRALVARADGLLAKYAADLDANPRAIDELWKIYRFLDAEVANAGRPKGAAHDSTVGIPASSYDACAKALLEHLDRNPRWLKADTPIAQPAVRARAEFELATLDMLNDSPRRLLDAATRLGIVGARRKLLLDTGILVIDTGKADDARVERMRAILDRLPAVRADTEAISFGDDNPRLSARGAVLVVKTPLDGSVVPPSAPFDDEVEPGPFDATTLEMARDLSAVAVRRALDNRPDLRIVADRDLRAAGAAKLGHPADGSVEAGLASAMQLLLTDAPRAMDLAFVRFLGKDPASAAILSDAMGILAAYAPNGAPLGMALGKPKGNDGATETLAATNVHLMPSGAVLAFTAGGHAWTLTRDAGPVTAVQRDGLPLSISMLAAARVPASEATSWSVPGFVLAKMYGAPRAGLAPGPRVRLLGTSEHGYDVVATAAPGPDVVVDTDVNVQNETAGIVLRAGAAKDGFRGAALLLTPGASPRIALVLREDDGFESFLAAPVDVPELGLTHVHLVVRGTKVSATVGDHELHGTIPATLARGEIAFVARKGAVMEAVNVFIKRP